MIDANSRGLRALFRERLVLDNISSSKPGYDLLREKRLGLIEREAESKYY